MRLYMMVVLVLVGLVAQFGFLGPMLISAASTELVLIGIFIMIISVPIYYFMCKAIFNEIKKRVIKLTEKGENNETD